MNLEPYLEFRYPVYQLPNFCGILPVFVGTTMAVSVQM